MQLDVIARGLTDLEYRRFCASPEGVTFELILENLDKCDAIEVLGSGKLTDEVTEVIKSTMADIAGQYK